MSVNVQPNMYMTPLCQPKVKKLGTALIKSFKNCKKCVIDIKIMLTNMIHEVYLRVKMLRQYIVCFLGFKNR